MLLATMSKNVIRRTSPISASVVNVFTRNERSYVFYNTSINIRREISSLKLVSDAVSYFSSILKVKVLANRNSLNRPVSCGVTYRSSNYVLESIYISCRSITRLGVTTNLGISKRFMHRSKHIASKNTFHLLDRLFDSSLLNQITTKDHSAFLRSIYDHSFDPNEGTLQHKYTLLHSIFRQKYDLSVYAKYYIERFPDTKVNFAPNVLTDFRVLGELPVVHHYENTFKNDIKKMILTGDSIATNFENQKQTNPDVLVYLSSPYGVKDTYQDIKSGMNIVKHSSRGSIGLLTFDNQLRAIPFTNHDLTLKELQIQKVNAIELGLKHDGLYDDEIFKALSACSKILRTESDQFKAHLSVEQLLWKKIQCNPTYKRSIAFTFTEFQKDIPITNKETCYRHKFISLLTDRVYDPSKIGDRREIYKAMLIAYRDVDSDLVKKIQYLVNTTGIEIDNHFLQTLATLIKQTLI